MNRSNSNVGLFVIFFLAGYLAVRILTVATFTLIFLAKLVFGLASTVLRNVKEGR